MGGRREGSRKERREVLHFLLVTLPLHDILEANIVLLIC